MTTVTIEVNLMPGVLYRFTGLGDAAVREGRDRIASAMQVNGFRFPNADITVNMAPADLRKKGSGFDLPLAMAILAASGAIVSDKLGSYMMVGELSLDGTLQPVRGALPIAVRARAEKFRGLIVPKQNVREAAVVNNLEVYGMERMTDVIAFLTGTEQPEPTVIDTRKEFYEHQYSFDLDFADVRGQETVKRALEVAAAGGHNMIMIGPPGSGKSMMAKRLPSILPPLSLAESLETTQIHSVAGKLGRGTSLISQRPFRAPHHTISEVALVGGGLTPQPGEISLAHNGVLFADELPEFNKSTLEVLRQPLEDHKITISRAKYTVEFPCSFMFVASMNPCPCGYYGDPTHRCVCTPGQIQRYMNKISGPLLNRIDIQTEITPVPFKDISRTAQGEPSAAIRERVINARKRQEQRYAGHAGIHCNAQMSERMIHLYAEPDDDGIALLRTAMERLSLSARAYNRILKVARTVADLDGSASVRAEHIAEAVSYRNLDRGDWADRGQAFRGLCTKQKKGKRMFENIKAVAFDADDTLWDNQSYFEKAERRYCELLAPYASAENVSAALFATEKANMELLGYGGKAFTISLVENALRLSGWRIGAATVGEIIATGKSLLHIPATPLPGVRSTLSRLSSLPLAVFTKGELLDQRGKLRRSGLEGFFAHVEIVPDKTEEAFRALCRQMGIATSELLMVGNSLRSDIAPALNVGAAAAWVPFRVTWKLEHAEEFAHERMAKLSSVEELPPLLGL